MQNPTVHEASSRSPAQFSRVRDLACSGKTARPANLSKLSHHRKTAHLDTLLNSIDNNCKVAYF
jgi:arginine deiminase